VGEYGTFRLFQPVLPAVAGNIHCELKPAPDAEFVEGAAQVILNNLLGRSHKLADFAIGKALPDQGGHL